MADYLGKQPVRNDGIYDGSENDQPSSAAIVASERNASIDETTLNKRPTAKDGDEDKIALDVSMSDGNVNSINNNNPLPVTITDSTGDEKVEYQEDVDVTKNGGTANHDYVTGAEFRGLNAEGSSSGLAKFELQIETAAASGVFDTVMSKFNSVSQPQVVFQQKYPTSIPVGVTIRIVKTNLEKNQNNDIYTLINGVEV